MISMNVNQLKIGDKLAEDVLTPLGSTLFLRDEVISERVLDILDAFMVQNVSINAPVVDEDQKKNNQASEAVKKTAVAAAITKDFSYEYNRMIEQLRKGYQMVSSGLTMPLMDIRKQLGKLFEHSSEYNVITYTPKQFDNNDYGLHKSVVTSLTSYMLAQWIGFPQKDWMPIALAGLLMDIGNLKVDPEILNKPSQLTNLEKDEMKKHTIFGYLALKNVTAINEGVKLAALQHHERMDGSGYPSGLLADQIHPYAKVVAIADIYHAMTLNKVYRKPISPYLVMEQIQSDAFGKLDPAYVRIFIEKATKLHTGTKVKLSDGRIGEIVFYERDYPTRPWISINNAIINLTQERQLHIVEIK